MTTEVTLNRVLNFSPGPAVLPVSVLEQIRDEMVCLPDVGSSVLEISHRGPEFGRILNGAKEGLRRILSISDDYEILFLQGGAVLQFTMVPANLLTDKDQTADFIVTGSWGKKSGQDAGHFGRVNIAWNGEEDGFRSLPGGDDLRLTDGAAFVHCTMNETIQGVQFKRVPEVGITPLACDASSDLLCGPLDVNRFGLIYACAQKNCGVAGLTVVIIRRDLLERSGERLPLYLDYQKHAAANSMANTPPTFAVYVLGLVCGWLEDEIGGLERMKEINVRKAQMLYETIDESDGFYRGHARPEARSIMNVVFTLSQDDLQQDFLSQASEAGMTTLKGHRSLGGIRASIYNAMPTEGVKALADFMRDFAIKHG